jgi:hypothetical protein
MVQIELFDYTETVFLKTAMRLLSYWTQRDWLYSSNGSALNIRATVAGAERIALGKPMQQIEMPAT